MTTLRREGSYNNAQSAPLSAGLLIAAEATQFLSSLLSLGSLNAFLNCFCEFVDEPKLFADDQPMSDSSSEDASPTPKPRFRRAVVISVSFHLLLLGGLLFWSLPRPSELSKQQSTSAMPADDSLSNQQSAPIPKPAPADVPHDQIKDSLADQIDQVAKLPDDKKLSELEKNLKRLEEVADEESVADVSVAIASSLGLDSEQYAEKEASTEGEFDANSAQLIDVSRKRNESGEWVYESIMVDANGHQQTVQMDQANGELIFQTFQQMKKYPMAEGIYRSVVMPLMQQMLEAQDLAEKAAIEAERLERDRAGTE